MAGASLSFWNRVVHITAAKSGGLMFGLVMAFDFAFQTVNRAAVRAFDGAVGLNRQENTRMAVPRFVFRAGAVQGQVVRGDNDSGVLVAHRVSFFIICAAGGGRCRRAVGFPLLNQ